MYGRNKKGRRTNNSRRLPTNKGRSQPVYQSNAYGNGATVNVRVGADDREDEPYDPEDLKEVK